MQIFVDADACPVRGVIVKIAKQFNLKVTMVVDTCHELDDGYSTVVTVDKAKDSVDIALINLANAGDIVVTQDYGVAAMALGKRAQAINQNGMLYTDSNIDGLLIERHWGQKVRRGGGRTACFKKRSKENNESFAVVFRRLCHS